MLTAFAGEPIILHARGRFRRGEDAMIRSKAAIACVAAAISSLACGGGAETREVAAANGEAPRNAAPVVATIEAKWADPDGSEAAAGEWALALSKDPGHSSTVAGFLTPDYGVTVGAGGLVYVTSDGGDSWQKADNESRCRFGLELLPGGLAWNCGNGGGNRASVDGGRTWRAIGDFGGDEPDQCRFISFCDATRGWVASPETMASTDDGGLSWVPMRLPEGLERICAISRRAPEAGCALDGSGAIFATEDSGATWRRIAMPDDFPAPSRWLFPAAAMRWTEDGRLVVAVNGAPWGGMGALSVMESRDSGATWSRRTIEVPCGSVFVSPDGNWIAVSRSGAARRILVFSRS
jgi:hypothetical protein